MKPEYTGKGMGTELVDKVLNFGKEKYAYNEMNLLVAKFNARAIRVYEKLGFEIVDEFIWEVNNEKKDFVEMKKVWNN